MDIEFADLQEGGGEVCSGFMLRDLAHVCEEDLDILASLFFICFGIKAKCFEAFRPAVCIDLFDSNGAFCITSDFIDLANSRTGSSSPYGSSGSYGGSYSSYSGAHADDYR